MSGGNNNKDGDDDGGWESKFLKVAGAAAAAATIAGGLYSLLTSSSSGSNYEPQAPFESRARHVSKKPDDDDGPSLDHHESPSKVRWEKPDFGWVKLNVDGSCGDRGCSFGGCGGVLRDASGTWLLGFAQKLDPSCVAHETEIQAILTGLQLAWEMNVEKLVVESDSESAVSMVENGLGYKYTRPHFDNVSRIRQLCSDPKWQVKVDHIPRIANGVANILARNARRLPSHDVLKYPSSPQNCTHLVLQEAQGVSL